MGAAHSYIKRVFCATGFCGTHHDLRSGKRSNSSRKTATKKVIHKSAIPPSAGSKTSDCDNHVRVLSEYSDIQNVEKLDFPEGNARFEANGCKSTPTRNFYFCDRMSSLGRMPYLVMCEYPRTRQRSRSATFPKKTANEISVVGSTRFMARQRTIHD
jgi:hypothetical protein